MKALRVFGKALAGLALAIVVAGGVFLALSTLSLPKIDGALTVAGLSAPVNISRDAHGIPLITAQSEDDAYFALGYLHAQDRLFQMEMMRRQGAGRVSELIGPAGVNSDKFMRTLRVYDRADADFRGLQPATQHAFERYAAGVNAWLDEGHMLPLEFQLLMFKPEPWTTTDSLVWQKLMGLTLSGNWDSELAQAALIAKLGPEKAAALTPDPRPEDPVTTRQAELFPALRPAELRAAMTAALQPTSASNAWVVDGGHSTTGLPIVANDPHLGFQSPIIWYFAGIDTPTLKIFGATVPGVPLHLLGHNGKVAWGITTPESDTADLFIEQVTGDGVMYDTPDGPRRFQTTAETLAVRFAKPVNFTVRETRHGPVVSDILARTETAAVTEGNKVLALQSALLQPYDRSADGVYRINHAGDANAFVQAISSFHAPHQNMMFADVDGAIGYYAPGRVPVRGAGDGSVPVPGWTGEYDWHGLVSFETLPHELAPVGGILINANNKMVDASYPYLMAAHWSDAYRAQRLEELLPKRMPSSPEAMAKMQQDVVSLMAREMLPLLLEHAAPTTDRENGLAALLKAWDGSMDRMKPEPLVFTLWMERLKTRLVDDELGEVAGEFSGLRPEVVRNILTKDNSWCDDVRTPGPETCAQQVTGALADVGVWLDQHGIGDVSKVRWGDHHQARFGHMLFSNFPGISGIGARSIPTSGDNYTVNRGSSRPSTSATPFAHVHGASLRAIYDFADLAKSKFALAGGQSGQITSQFYGDLLENWRDGAYFTAPTTAETAHHLTLQPPKP